MTLPPLNAPGAAPSPRTLGAILAESFALLRVNGRPMIRWAMLLPFGITAALTLLSMLVSAWIPPGLDIGRELPPVPTFIAEFLVTGVRSELPLVGGLCAAVIVQALALTNLRAAVQDRLADRTELMRGLSGNWGILLGYGFLRLLIIGGIFAVAFGIVALLAVLGASLEWLPLDLAGVFLILLVMIAVTIGASIPAIWVATVMSLGPAVIVFEGASIRAALRRSFRLVEGRFWRVLGAQFIIGALAAAAAVSLAAIGGLALAPLFILGSGGAGAVEMPLVPAFLIQCLPLAVSAVAGVVSAYAIGLLALDADARMGMRAAR